MKKFILLPLVLLLMISPVSAGSVPVFRTGERIVTVLEKGSDEELALKAAKTGLSEKWFLDFTTGEKVLEAVTYRTLSSILPMKDVVLLEKKDGAVALYSLSTKDFISFSFRDGKIAAVNVLGNE